MAEESGMGRLTKAILELDEEERCDVLKAALGDALTAFLLKVVIDLPEERQEQLARLAEGMGRRRGKLPAHPEPAAESVAPEEPDAGVKVAIGDRKHRRIPFAHPVECSAGEKRVRGVSLDISAGGMFLANTGGLSLHAGQRFQVTFYPPGEDAAVAAACEVVRVEEKGVAVKFVGRSFSELAAHIGRTTEKN